MEISVVIPTYRRVNLLLECLYYLDLQTIEKHRFEVIVVSDGPDESTASAVKRLNQSNVACMHTQTRQGPAAARNLGWKSARARLIAFTDDDCRPEPGWLAGFLASYTGREMAVFSGLTRVPAMEHPTDFALNTRHLQQAAFITANCACTRQALELAGGFDERYGTAWREDSDLEFRFLELNIPITKVREAIVTHPVRPNVPWGVSIKEQKKGLYDALLYKKYPELYRSRIRSSPLWHYYAIVASALVLAASLVFHQTRLTYTSALILSGLTMIFFIYRIIPTSKKPSHVLEMLVTSAVIPFVSVYWRFYGAFKYRVFFI